MTRLILIGLISLALATLAIAQCPDGSEGTLTTYTTGRCSFYNGTAGCCGDITSNPPPDATLSEGYGATACDEWAQCKQIVDISLCGYLLLQCPPSSLG